MRADARSVCFLVCGLATARARDAAGGSEGAVSPSFRPAASCGRRPGLFAVRVRRRRAFVVIGP